VLEVLWVLHQRCPACAPVTETVTSINIVPDNADKITSLANVYITKPDLITLGYKRERTKLTVLGYKTLSP